MNRRGFIACALVLALAGSAAPAHAQQPGPAGALRVAAFNVALSRTAPGALVQELRLGGSPQIDAVTEIVQRTRADILALFEVDRDARGVALRLLAETFAEGRGGAEGVDYPHRIAPPVNTGRLTGHDLDGDGRIARPEDAHAYGFFTGQFGMALLSRFPIAEVRTFATLRWADLPGADIPPGRFPAAAEAELRLCAKTCLVATVETPQGPLKVVAAHPRPPVFDGPADANGRRNADELRLLGRLLDPRPSAAAALADDAGVRGGVGPGPVVLLGDLNADPQDGDGRREMIRALLAHPRLVDPRPASRGGTAAADPDHAGDPAHDTAAFGRDPGPGNLRADYALPSRDLELLGAGVFWPPPGDPLRRLVGDGEAVVSSDHRLVWLDIALPKAADGGHPD